MQRHTKTRAQINIENQLLGPKPPRKPIRFYVDLGFYMGLGFELFCCLRLEKCTSRARFDRFRKNRKKELPVARETDVRDNFAPKRSRVARETRISY